MNKLMTTMTCAAIIGLGGGVGAAGSVGVAGEAPSASTSMVGPPAVCELIKCDKAGVKFGRGPFDTVRGYSVEQAMGDALKTLDESDDALSHMETVRRVVVYLKDDPGRTNELLAQLLARAADAEADGVTTGARALAWLDAGYLVGASSQMGIDLGWRAGESQGVAGLAWLERAAESATEDGGDVAAVHFAAAILTHPAMRDNKRSLYTRHMGAAIEGAGKGSLLMKNIEAHAKHWDESVKDLRRDG